MINIRQLKLIISMWAGGGRKMLHLVQCFFNRGKFGHGFSLNVFKSYNFLHRTLILNFCGEFHRLIEDSGLKPNNGCWLLRYEYCVRRDFVLQKSHLHPSYGSLG